jgi:hypothetical protein
VSSSHHLRTETDTVSETLCFLLFRIPDDGQSPEPQWFCNTPPLNPFRFSVGALGRKVSGSIPDRVMTFFNWRSIIRWLTLLSDPKITLALLSTMTLKRLCFRVFAPSLVLRYVWNACWKSRSVTVHGTPCDIASITSIVSKWRNLQSGNRKVAEGQVRRVGLVRDDRHVGLGHRCPGEKPVTDDLSMKHQESSWGAKGGRRAVLMTSRQALNAEDVIAICERVV